MCGVACKAETESELALTPLEASAMPPSVTLGSEPPKPTPHPPNAEGPGQRERDNSNKDILTIDLSGDENDDLQKAIALSLQERQDNACIQGISAEDQEVSKVLEASLRESRPHDTVDLINPLDRKRESGVHVGLKNIGNSCWFNVVVQPLFHISAFRDMILNYRQPPQTDDLERHKISLQRILPKLQKLFALMIGSDRKYIDPSESVNFFQGQEMRRNAQQDVCEFIHKLLQRLEEEYNLFLKEQGAEKESSYGQVSKDAEFENPIMKLFYGQSKKDVTDDDIVTKQETFGQYPLRVMMYKDIHDSILASMTGKMPDVDQNIVEPVQQDIWFKMLPPILIFSLSRYEYSHEKQRAEKVHNKFEFPETLFMDRYMEINKACIKEKHIKVAKLRQELNALNKTLDKYLHFGSGKEKYPIHDILRYTLEFAETKEGSDEASILSPLKMDIDGMEDDYIEMDDKVIIVNDYTQLNDYFKENNTDSNLVMEVTACSTATPLIKTKVLPPAPRSIDPTELQTFRTCLPRWLHDIERQVAELQSCISLLEHQLDNMYNESFLKQIPYKLHAVVVHEGQASGGHYWVYVFDQSKKNWVKFNDIQVTDSEWKEVWMDSVGGQNNASAYCLMYIDESRYSMLFPNPMENMENVLTDLHVDLQDYVKQENLLFLKEIQNWELKQKQQAESHSKAVVAESVQVGDVPATAPNSPKSVFFKQEYKFLHDIKTMLMTTVSDMLVKDSAAILEKESGKKIPYILKSHLQRLKNMANENHESVRFSEPSLCDFGIYLFRNNVPEDPLITWYGYEVIWEVTNSSDVTPVVEHVRQEARQFFNYTKKTLCQNHGAQYSGWMQHYRRLIECAWNMCIGFKQFSKKNYEIAMLLFSQAHILHKEIEKNPPDGVRKTLDYNILNYLYRTCLISVNVELFRAFLEATSENQIRDVVHKVFNIVIPSVSLLCSSSHKCDIHTVDQVRERWCDILGHNVESGFKHRMMTEILNAFFSSSSESKLHVHIKIPELPSALALYTEYKELATRIQAVLHRPVSQNSDL